MARPSGGRGVVGGWGCSGGNLIGLGGPLLPFGAQGPSAGLFFLRREAKPFPGGRIRGEQERKKKALGPGRATWAANIRYARGGAGQRGKGNLSEDSWSLGIDEAQGARLAKKMPFSHFLPFAPRAHQGGGH